ncbi:MAG: hydantoinase B/oxoprolinase family protein [Pirellulales bacterium]|nr:hydantoinase B/oxoprolinase family protein [Pirellulales bacterium]
MNRTASQPDPIVLEIMRNRWRGISEEVCAAMIRTSYSPNIKTRFDCSAAIALPDGQIVAQAEVGTPLHLGIMPAVIRSILRQFPLDAMQPGDAFITNLPYPEGPGHLPDVSLVSPVFHQGAAVALAATTSHHVDVGGYAPGSMPFGVTEIYQEGLQIPPIRLVCSGEINDELLRFIEQNVRTKLEMRGDLMAQIAAARTAERRVAELFDNHDPALVQRYMDHILDHAESCMRAGIEALPDGVYTYEDYLDDDGVTDEPVKISARITIQGSEFTADFSGSDDQVLGPLNCRISACRACTYYVVKAVVDPTLPTCAGAYRPIHVIAREGSVLNAHFPAAIGNANILTDQRVVDVLLGALLQVVPERVCAACSGEMNLVNMGGIDPATGQYFNYVETYAGGQGAHFDLDGADGVHTHLTNTRNTPVEVIEKTYPLRVNTYGLVPDTEGPGRQRGGCGIVRELVCLADRTAVTMGADRRRFTPWGVDTTHRATGQQCYLIKPDGSRELLPTKFFIYLNKGDCLRIETPGGGGWGDPQQRDADRIDSDVLAGLVSAERAAEIYGRS